MRRFTISFLVVAFLSVSLFAGEGERIARTNWDAFSKNLVRALATDNTGLKISAMQHIVTYHNYLDINDGVFDLMRIYRMHPDQKMRQMALVSLLYSGNSWAQDFLKRNLRFENNPVLKRQIAEWVISNREKSMAGESKDLAAN